MTATERALPIILVNKQQQSQQNQTPTIARTHGHPIDSQPTPGGPMIVPVQYLIIMSSESLNP
jgi:hypothetical protein